MPAAPPAAAAATARAAAEAEAEASAPPDLCRRSFRSAGGEAKVMARAFLRVKCEEAEGLGTGKGKGAGAALSYEAAAEEMLRAQVGLAVEGAGAGPAA